MIWHCTGSCAEKKIVPPQQVKMRLLLTAVEPKTYLLPLWVWDDGIVISRVFMLTLRCPRVRKKLIRRKVYKKWFLVVSDLGYLDINIFFHTSTGWAFKAPALYRFYLKSRTPFSVTVSISDVCKENCTVINLGLRTFSWKQQRNSR